MGSTSTRRWAPLAVLLQPLCLIIAAPANAATAAQPGSSEEIRTTLQTVAIVVAVLVFLTREGLEARRRNKSRQRQIAAIKIGLARACELNNWTVKSLRSQFAAMPSLEEETEDDGRPPEFAVSFRRNGRVDLLETKESEVRKISPLLEARLEDLKANFLDVAELEPNLLPVLDEAITALENLNHARDSLVSYLLKEDEFAQDFDEMLPSFVSYGRECIEDTHQALDVLYKRCTGKALTEHRVR